MGSYSHVNSYVPFSPETYFYNLFFPQGKGVRNTGEVEEVGRLKSTSSQTDLSLDPSANSWTKRETCTQTSPPPRSRTVRTAYGRRASMDAGRSRDYNSLRASKERLPEVPLAEKPSSYMTRNINKMSHRGRCIPTPPLKVLRDREQQFVNDGVHTERTRTKYNDAVLPRYDGSEDPHCRAYFKRIDVQKLIHVTKTLKPV